MTRTADVLIVGAGPTGLLLAGDLASAGVRTTVLERRDADSSNVTRAFALHARSLEMLDARGLADEVVATGQPVHTFNLFDHVDLDLSGLPSRFPYVLITPQYNTEAALLHRAEKAGARIVRGSTVNGLRQDDEGVDVDSSDGGWRARYVVGTDGVHSTVRTALGLDFPGQSIVKSLMLADVKLTSAPSSTLTINANSDCFAFVAPFGDGWYRIFAWNRRNPKPDSEPVDFDEVRDVTRRALGTDFGMHDPRWMSRFHSDERQVRTYRVGRVLLAGDAAHVHTPAGGQGMNTGLQDAANLGWKLAATVNGHAPADLLDTYHTERHPVGKTVLRSSGALIRMVMIQSRPGRAARNTIGGAALHVGPLARKFSGMLSGIGIGYPAPAGAPHLVGQRARDVLLAADSADPTGPVRLYEALRGGRFVLATTPETDLAVPGGYADRVRRVTTADGSASLLVRPDGYIAWSGGKPDSAGLTAALRRWAGSPS